jgi:hypothetical protein
MFSTNHFVTQSKIGSPKGIQWLPPGVKALRLSSNCLIRPRIVCNREGRKKKASHHTALPFCTLGIACPGGIGASPAAAESKRNIRGVARRNKPPCWQWIYIRCHAISEACPWEQMMMRLASNAYNCCPRTERCWSAGGGGGWKGMSSGNWRWYDRKRVYVCLQIQSPAIESSMNTELSSRIQILYTR